MLPADITVEIGSNSLGSKRSLQASYVVASMMESLNADHGHNSVQKR